MQKLARAAHLAIPAALLIGGLHAQTTTRVSLGYLGVEPDAASGGFSSVSANGRFVAFMSAATNLVPVDTNGFQDIFVRDRLNGSTELVSIATGGAQGTTDCDGWASISGDGRYVAFTSRASNLVAGDTNGWWDIFVRDRLNGTTERVSLDSAGAEANERSFYPTLSADGRFVAFLSYASNLVAGDTNGFGDVFVRDQQTGLTELVSISTAGTQGDNFSVPWSVSPDGRYVAFFSYATTLTPNDTNGFGDVFLRDRLLGTTSLVSVDSAGAQGNGDSGACSLSANGRYVAFSSSATNLVPGDTNGASDVFVHDGLTGLTERISVGSAGTEANLQSELPSISADGRYVAFQSDASNLVAGDTNGKVDAFLRDRLAGSTTLVSVAATAVAGDGRSDLPAISADGSCVEFRSEATNLVPGDNGMVDVFVRDVTCTGSISIYCTAKTNSLGCLPSIGSVGLPSQSGPDNFYVTASNVLNQKSGMMIWGGAQASIPFHGGVLCIAPPIVRTPIQNSGGSTGASDCSGSYAFHFTQAYMAQQFLIGGYSTVYAQYWSRDPGFAAPNSIGLTNALSFTICP